MSAFVKGGSVTTPFGRNEFLRSTKEGQFQTESYTVAASTVPARTIDGATGQKILQPGTVMAKITSGGESGKIGPFQAGVTDGRQTLANIVGLELTFLPWQLMERDVEVSVVYDCVAVQGWCKELDAAGAEIVLTNTTADAMRSTKGLDIKFK
jgi:hypothetical protein